MEEHDSGQPRATVASHVVMGVACAASRYHYSEVKNVSHCPQRTKRGYTLSMNMLADLQNGPSRNASMLHVWVSKREKKAVSALWSEHCPSFSTCMPFFDRVFKS